MNGRDHARDAVWRGMGSRVAHRVATAVLPDRPVVVAYHDVPDRAVFAQHLDHYVENFHVVDLDLMIDAARRGAALPRRSLLITFDDGDRSIYENALPALVERGLPAAAFLIADLIDTEEPFWWTEVAELTTVTGNDDPDAAVGRMKVLPNRERLATIEGLRQRAGRGGSAQTQLTTAELVELDRAGIAIGNHTASHPLLDQCDDEEVRREIVDAHERLCAVLGHHPGVFAYPNGNLDERAPGLLRSLGYELAFGFDHRRLDLRWRDPYALSRVRVDATAPLHEVRAITSGLHPLVHTARQKLSGHR